MDAAQHIDGYRIPVHRSVTQPIMMAGDLPL
jgi:type IV secretory pathway TrbD component